MDRIGRVTKTLINNNTFTANNNINIDDNYLGIQWVQPPSFLLEATENSGSSNMQCFLQSSFDGGTAYQNMLTFTDLSATGNEVLSASCSNTVAQHNPCGDKVRLQHVQNTTGNWSITLRVSGFARGGSGS